MTLINSWVSTRTNDQISFSFWDALFYQHYVDDVTCSFNSEQDAKIR